MATADANSDGRVDVVTGRAPAAGSTCALWTPLRSRRWTSSSRSTRRSGRNLLVYLHVEGQRTAAAEAVLRRDADWVVPIVWRTEFRTALAGLVRRRALALEDALRIVTEAERGMAAREYTVASQQVLLLAEQSGCSACDCEYVSLAQDLSGIPSGHGRSARARRVSGRCGGSGGVRGVSLLRDRRLLVLALGGRALRGPSGRTVGPGAWVGVLEQSLPPLADLAAAGFRFLLRTTASRWRARVAARSRRRARAWTSMAPRFRARRPWATRTPSGDSSGSASDECTRAACASP